MKARGISSEEGQKLLLQRRPHVNPRLTERPVVREYASDLAQKWGVLDEFEGEEYERVLTEVALNDGTVVTAS